MIFCLHSADGHGTSSYHSHFTSLKLNLGSRQPLWCSYSVWIVFTSDDQLKPCSRATFNLKSTSNKGNCPAARTERKADWSTCVSWEQDTRLQQEEGSKKNMGTLSPYFRLTATTYSREEMSPWASNPPSNTGKGSWAIDNGGKRQGQEPIRGRGIAVYEHGERHKVWIGHFWEKSWLRVYLVSKL